MPFSFSYIFLLRTRERPLFIFVFKKLFLDTTVRAKADPANDLAAENVAEDDHALFRPAETPIVPWLSKYLPN